MASPDTVRFTRADYMRLPEGFPAILLDGEFLRKAAPSFGHQALVLDIAMRLSLVAPRRVLTAPVDVVIDDHNVLQPDVLVFGGSVRDAREAGPDEIPVLVVEVLSPSTAERDRDRETAAHLRAGVSEIWLVDPAEGSIDHVTPEATQRHAAGAQAVSAVVPGFRMRWSDLR